MEEKKNDFIKLLLTAMIVIFGLVAFGVLLSTEGERSTNSAQLQTTSQPTQAGSPRDSRNHVFFGASWIVRDS